MRLVDRIAQCRTPFVVRDLASGGLTRLNGAAEFASQIASCPIRFVLCDELTRLCTALAYSKGARQLACADLLRIPGESVWVEWSDAVCLKELERYGFKMQADDVKGVGHRGVLIRAARDGRSGVVRAFWTLGTSAPQSQVLASSMEAYFDLDTPDNDEPEIPHRVTPQPARVYTGRLDDEPDLLRRYFRFRYEHSWGEYYRRAGLSAQNEAAIARHALGTIAADIPMFLAFFLLLATRDGLPQRPQSFDRLNRSRARSGKVPLLDHIEVLCPLLAESAHERAQDSVGGRRAPRLHHVRGHLVRRGSELHWRVPHLRGTARSGRVRSRTVTWTIDQVH
jgi:hypothetical protein